MQKLFQLTTLLAVTLAISIASSAEAQWPEYTQIGEKNYIEIGGRAYNRPGTDLQLSILQDATTGQTLFSANQATAASSAAGVELSYHFETKYRRQMEFRTFTGTWDSNTVIDAGNIVSPLFPGDIADEVDYNYGAQIFSFELNQKRPLFRGATLFGGPRYVYISDEVNYTATQFPDLIGPGQTFEIAQSQTLEAINHLIGLQAGLRYEKAISQYFRGAGFIRAGGYYNPTKVRTSFESGPAALPPMSTLDTEATKSTGSLLVELGGRMYVDFAPNCAFFAGYEATWIDGIALAPPSFLTTETNEVETANTLFMHAVTFGMRFGW